LAPAAGQLRADDAGWHRHGTEMTAGWEISKNGHAYAVPDPEWPCSESTAQISQFCRRGKILLARCETSRTAATRACRALGD
jgi:hypothetical protein